MIPLRDTLAVRPDSGGEVLPSGIIMPDMGQETSTGMVVAIGPDVLEVSTGDRIVYDMMAGPLLFGKPTRVRDLDVSGVGTVQLVRADGVHATIEDSGGDIRSDIG